MVMRDLYTYFNLLNLERSRIVDMGWNLPEQLAGSSSRS